MARAASPASLPALLGARAGPARETLRAGWGVLGCAIGLSALGIVMLYSSSSGIGLARGVDPMEPLVRQLRWIFLAGLVGWAASALPLPVLARLGRPAMAAALLLLAATLLVGTEVNGSRRWLRLAGLSVQPSELLKVAVVLYLAERLAARARAAAFGEAAPLLGMLAPVGLGAILVLVQPDLGTALFVVAQAVVLLALAGVRPTRVLPFALTAAPLLLLYAYTRFGHVRRRLAGTGAQVEEALVALGSGGVAGRGLGAGTRKIGHVPETNTDFIFSVIGEELGFLGCAAVVVAFMAIAWCGRRVAWNARVLGQHATWMVAGAVFLVTFQALINLAVVTATAPTKGIPLPFISMGGTNLLACAACIGLVVGAARRTAQELGESPW